MLKVILIAVAIVTAFKLLALLPAIVIDVDAVVASSAWHWIRAAMYFLPTGTVIIILSIIFALGVFRLIVALVKTIWDMLPVG